MNLSFRPLRTLPLSFLLVTTSLSGAFADTAGLAAERLKALVQKQGAVIEWDRVDISGDDAVLVNVRVGTEQDKLPIGDVALNDVTATAEGYRIGEIVFDPFETGDDTSTVTIEDAQMDGVLLPEDANMDQYGGSLFYEKAYIGSMSVAIGDDEIMSLSEFVTQMTAPANGEPMKYSGSAEEFYLDLSVIEDPTQKAVLQALDYEQLYGSFAFEGYWQPTDGRFALTKYDTVVTDAGTLGLTFDMGGYTPAFLASLRDLQAQITANPDGDTSTQGLAILGLMQQLIFHSTAITFTDDSLTNKVLEYVAKSQGMKASDIANQAKAVLPFVLGQLGNPELTAQATQAVNAFLDNPKSLTIKATPPAPVPFALIAAGAMSNPMDLTKTLGVTVSAND